MKRAHDTSDAAASAAHDPLEDEWRSLAPQGFSAYEASRRGAVRNIIRGTTSKMSPAYHGYIPLSIVHDDGTTKYFLAHRIIADAFLPADPLRPLVAHINHNRADNAVENLMRCDRNDIVRLGRRKCPIKIEEAQRRGVYAMRDGFPDAYYRSINDAAETTGIDASSITNACRGRLKTSGGFRWRYAEQEQIDGEEWRTLPEYDVDVSNKGRIRGKTGKIRIGNASGGPYLRTTIHHRQVKVHKLVALAFIGPRPDGMTVDHIDRNKANNAADNLRYATIIEQAQNRGPHKTAVFFLTGKRPPKRVRGAEGIADAAAPVPADPPVAE